VFLTNPNKVYEVEVEFIVNDAVCVNVNFPVIEEKVINIPVGNTDNKYVSNVLAL
jgi:hypothetical protein